MNNGLRDSLPDWDEQTMIPWLKNHSTFDNIVLLGKDTDNVGYVGCLLPWKLG
jgi:hypothetical protein